MAPPRKPRKYKVEACSVQCTLNPHHFPAGGYDAIHAWYEQGLSMDQIQSNAKVMGWEVTTRALYRHMQNHMVPVEHLTHFGENKDPVILDPDAPVGKMSDLDILDKIIQAGSKQLSQQSVRITPEMTMKAMELRLKLTQGSVFDDFLSAVGAAFGDAGSAVPSSTVESAAAVRSTDEQQQGADEPD